MTVQKIFDQARNFFVHFLFFVVDSQGPFLVNVDKR